MWKCCQEIVGAFTWKGSCDSYGQDSYGRRRLVLWIYWSEIHTLREYPKFAQGSQKMNKTYCGIHISGGALYIMFENHVRSCQVCSDKRTTLGCPQCGYLQISASKCHSKAHIMGLHRCKTNPSQLLVIQDPFRIGVGPPAKLASTRGRVVLRLGPFHPQAKGHHHGMVRVLDYHLKAIPWVLGYPVCVGMSP